MRNIYRLITGSFLSAALALPADGQEALELSLAEAQDRALAGNQMLEVAREGVKQAQAMRLQTWAGHLPSVSLSEKAIRTNDAVNAFGFGLKQERFNPAALAVPAALTQPDAITDYQTVLAVRQPLFNGGQAIFGRRQARAGVKAAEAQLRRGEQEVRLRTAQAYWGLVLAQEALQAVRQALETARAHADAARAHYEQQTAPLSDLLAAQVRVAELRGEEIAAANRVAEGADALSLVMGLGRAVEVAPADTLSYRELGASMAELVAAALGGRADLVGAAQQAEAARQGVGVARADFLPHLNAFAQVDLDSDELLDRQGESWTVGAMVTWNIFSGFHSTGTLRRAKAKRGQARAQQEFLEAQAAREVEQAWRSVKAAQAQVEIAGEAVAQATERLRMTDLQFQEELASATDLLDAETALTQARVRRLQALHALNVGLARLEHAAGRPID